MSFLGFIGKAVLGGLNIATGGVSGAVAGALGIGSKTSAGSGGGGVMPASPIRAPIIGTTMGFQLRPGLVGTSSGGAFKLASSAYGPAQPSQVPAASAGAAGSGAVIPCGKGYHQKKGTHALLLPTCVKNRHMNVTNPKALRRALRRAYGFEKLAMRTIHLLHPRKRAHFGGFKRPRSRARTR